MAKIPKTTHNWKTKKEGNRIYMICQNSKPEFSKYPDYGPEDGEVPCKEWEEVAKNTSAVLCARCTSRYANV